MAKGGRLELGDNILRIL